MNAANPEYAIEADALRRSFGSSEALRGLTLRVPRGSLYGFLGRNGAGKTTAIKIIAGLLKPDSGTVRVLGIDPFAFTPDDRRRVGYVSEKQILPAHMKVGALVAFTASFYPAWDHELARRLLDRFRLDRKKRIADLSQGGQRQVAFLLALAQRPELLILDEPASTLDVVARREFLDEVLELLRQDGPTVFLSSHILSDVERVADQIGIVADGVLRVSEPLDTLKETVKRVRFHSFSNGPGTFSLPGAFRTTRSADGRELLVTARIPDEGYLARAAQAAGASYEIEDMGLEEIFVELSRS
jgi:ABC-2 type transport system ATP-binding protein